MFIHVELVIKSVSVYDKLRNNQLSITQHDTVNTDILYI